jgi:glycosyltransferase involved in cell wall biosynthesis
MAGLFRGDPVTKILFVSDSLGVGGAEKQLLLQFKGLLARGVDARLALLHEEGELYSRALTEDLRARVAVYGMRHDGVLAAARGLRREVLSYAPDIVYSWLRFSTIMSAIVLRLPWSGGAGLRHVTTQRGSVRELHPLDPRRFLTIRAERSSSMTLFNSTSVRKEAVQRFGFTPGKTRFLPNAFSPLVVSNEERASARAALRGELGFGPEDPVITYLGRLHPLKAPDLIVEAWPAILSAFPSARLLMVGEGAMRSELEARVDALNVRHSVRFVGRQLTIQPYLFASDIYVSTSKSEGFSNATIEAMAAALPVVVSAVDGNLDCVVNGKNGFLFQPGSSRELANSVLALLADSERRKRMGEVARIFTSRMPAEDEVLTRLLSILQALHGGREVPEYGESEREGFLDLLRDLD